MTTWTKYFYMGYDRCQIEETESNIKNISDIFPEGKPVLLVKEDEIGNLVPQQIRFSKVENAFIDNKTVIRFDYDSVVFADLLCYTRVNTEKLKGYTLIGNDQQWLLVHDQTNIMSTFNKNDVEIRIKEGRNGIDQIDIIGIEKYMEQINLLPEYKKWEEEEMMRKEESERNCSSIWIKYFSD